MRSFSVSLPDPQAGHWQVYEKVLGNWIALGDPEPEESARDRVRAAIVEATPEERERRKTHAVPV